MQATKSPPTSQAAKKGNRLFRYEEAVLMSSGAKASSGLGFLGLGNVELVKGGFKPGQTLFGAVAGIPAQQGVSQIVVQQFLKGSPMVGNIVAGSVGVVTHFFVRSSFTLGLGLAMAAPLIAQATQYGVTWVANFFKPAAVVVTTPAMQGLQQQRVMNTVSGIRSRVA